ncbi:MAG: hypothetical protein AB9869_06150 [Verrucomicrobiia bacterium]
MVSASKAVTFKTTEEAADQSLAALVDEFLDAARRGMLADTHGAVIEAVERQLFPRAIEMAQGNQAQPCENCSFGRATRRRGAWFAHFG